MQLLLDQSRDTHNFVSSAEHSPCKARNSCSRSEQSSPFLQPFQAMQVLALQLDSPIAEKVPDPLQSSGAHYCVGVPCLASSR